MIIGKLRNARSRRGHFLVKYSVVFLKNTYAFKTVHGDGNVLLSLQVQSLHEHCSKETGEDSANPRAFYAAPKLTNFSKKKKKYGAYFYGVFFIYFQRKLLASSSARCSIVPGDQEWESANFHPCIELPSKAKKYFTHWSLVIRLLAFHQEVRYFSY